jgi:hypothetical protein
MDDGTFVLGIAAEKGVRAGENCGTLYFIKVEG